MKGAVGVVILFILFFFFFFFLAVWPKWFGWACGFICDTFSSLNCGFILTLHSNSENIQYNFFSSQEFVSRIKRGDSVATASCSWRTICHLKREGRVALFFSWNCCSDEGNTWSSLSKVNTVNLILLSSHIGRLTGWCVGFCLFLPAHTEHHFSALFQSQYTHTFSRFEEVRRTESSLSMQVPMRPSHRVTFLPDLKGIALSYWRVHTA